jgi:hypothetical protein
MKARKHVALTAYTPGPWKAHFMSGIHGESAILTESPEFVEEHWPYHPKIASVACMRDGPPREIGEANALMMAASPEMFQALKMFLAEHDNTYDGEGLTIEMAAFIDAARVAIAKAEGRT